MWIFLAIIFPILILIFAKKPNLNFLPNERIFKNYDKSEVYKFPDLFDSPKIYLSVIIPSYNEQYRLPIMLNESLKYLEKRQLEKASFTYEIIIVDDGSIDETTNVAADYSKKHGTEKLRVLTLLKNRGKGQAIKLGSLCARGEIILFADADGASKFSDFDKLERFVNDKIDPVLVCGSRAHLQEEALVKRSLFRNILMFGFQSLVSLIGGISNIKDTQCGFKLLTRPCAQIIFPNLHVERWAFDVELLYIAITMGVKIYEVPVEWHEVAGSKITPVVTWVQMGLDIVFIRLRYLLGIWTIKNTRDKSK